MLFRSVLGCFLTLLTASHSPQDNINVRDDLTRRQREQHYVLIYPFSKGSARGVDIVQPRERSMQTIDESRLEFQPIDAPVNVKRFEFFYFEDVLWVEDLLNRSRRPISSKCRQPKWAPSQAWLLCRERDSYVVLDTTAWKKRIIAHQPKVPPTWSPDGQNLFHCTFSECVLTRLPAGVQTIYPLSTVLEGVVAWSPDSQFVTYSAARRGDGSWRSWGCFLPYRVWIVRASDGAQDWVYDGCKPAGNFEWAKIRPADAR